MREVSFGKRLLSMVLALVMILGILPVANISGWFTKANAADGTSTGTKTPVDAAIMFSDLHTNKSDYKQEELEAIMSAFKYTGMPYSSVTSCGDAFSVNEDNSSSNGPYNGYSDTLVGYIKGSGGLGDSSVDVNFVWSDHDRYVYNNSTDMVKLDKKSHLAYGAGNDGTYGTADDANYYVYTLSMADLCSYDRYEAGFNYTTSTNNRAENGFTATVEEAIANFKADAAKLDKSKPLLIASHQPLFDNRNDNAWAEAWFDAINEVAAEMDVVFFYGHNHKYDSGSDYYYGKGSTMPVATADNWGFDYDVGEGYLPSMDLSSENKTLNFTHMCAGYLEPTSTGSYSSSTTRLGTAISIVIYEDSLVLQTYDADGLYTGNFAVNETVKRDHAVTVEVPVIPDSNGTGITVAAPGLSMVEVTEVEDPSYNKDLYGVYASYDITVDSGYTQGTAATVTIPAPAGFNASKPVYVLYSGEVIATTAIVSGTITFTTDHFSVYDVAQLADSELSWTLITEAVDKTIFRQTNSLTAGSTYVIVNKNAAGSANAVNLNGSSINSVGVTVYSDTEGCYIDVPATTAQWNYTSDKYFQSVSNTSSYLRGRSGSGTLRVGTSYSSYIAWNYSTTYGLYGNSSNYNINSAFSLANRSSSDRVYIYVKDTVKTNAVYAALGGTLNYEIANISYASSDDVKAMIRNNIVVYTASDNQGTGKDTTTEYTLEGNVNLNVAGENEITVKYGGETLGTITVNVKIKEIATVTVDDISVPRDTPPSAEKVKINVTYNDGTSDTFYAPLSELVGEFDLTKNGTYTGLKYTYSGTYEIPNITLEVTNKAGNDYPEYPDPGSVKVDKHADASHLQDYGMVNVQLSTSGLPYAKGVDVIVMLDMSSSMDRCISCGEYTSNWTNRSDACSCATSVSRVDELVKAMSALQTELQKSTNADNIKIAVADFNGVYTSGPSDYTDDGCSNTTQDVGALTNSGYGKVYTGEHGWNANAFIPASELDVTKFTDTSSDYSYAPSTGTNYDFAFDAVYQLGYAIKKHNEATNQSDRELVVIFMSDGAANQFNYYNTTGGRSGTAGTADWDAWLTGNVGEGKDFTFQEIVNCQDHIHYFDAKTGNQHRMANAIKGKTNLTYEIIRKNQGAGENGVDAVTDALIALTPEDDNYGKDNMYKLPGLGATTYTAAFYVTNDGNISAESAKHSLKGTATSMDHYIDAAEPDALTNAFAKIGGEIAYAASNAYYADQLGDSFNLQMGNTINATDADGNLTTVTLPADATPKIQILNYNIYKASDVNGTTVTAEMVGKRYGNPIVVEEITFNNEGTEAYSTLDSIGPNGETIKAGSNIYIGGVIYAKNFYYNNNLTSVKISDTITIEPETFRWNIGIVNNIEWVMSYWIYLAGSMEGKTSSGSYKTNNYAILYYENWLGNNAFQATTSPQVGWKSANVSYAFYLVNEQGLPVVNQTTGQTGNFKNAVKVANPVVFDEILLNNLENIDTIEASSLAVLPSGYDLYDETASYKVVVLSEEGEGSWTITFDEDKGANTSYVTGYLGDEYTTEPLITSTKVDKDGNAIAGLENHIVKTEYDYTHTTVWFAVIWVPKALPDAVVIDYGLPVDISVLVNDQFGENGKLSGVGSTAAKNTALESAGNTNIYTSSHSAAFVNKITSTYGTAEIVGDKVRYTPTTMDWGTGSIACDKFAYEYQYYNKQYNDGVEIGDEADQYYYGDVTVIPATSVYYEDTFMTYEGDWSVISNNASITQDEDRPGKYSISQIDKNNVYGYDSHYTAMSEYSLGNVHHITVNKGTFGKAYFTFHGTGFDVISLTSNKTGTLAIKVTAAEDIYEGGTLKFAAGAKAKAVIVDTYYGYTKDADGKWVTTTTDPNPLYQIPVMKIEDLPYGKYDVVITATYGEAYDHTDDAGYELYLDAIRIYDPAGDGSDLAIDEDGTARDKTIADIYAQDGEGWPIYEELRNQLIDEDTYKTAAGSDTYKGMIFIDSNGENASVTDYTNLGPNNELYLAAGQLVAFELDLSQYIVDKVINGKTVKQSIIADVQLGVKSADGKQVKVTLTADNVSASREFSTSTDMYYSFSQLVDLGTDTTGEDTANDSKTIVYIQNSNPEDSEGLVSITNIKVTFKQQPAAQEDSQFLFWSRNIGEAVLTMLQSASSNDKEPEVEEPVPEESKPEGETPEESKPEDEIPEESKPENETPKDEETGDNTTEDSDSDESVDPNPETGSRLSYIIGMITRFFRNIFGWIFN